MSFLNEVKNLHGIFRKGIRYSMLSLPMTHLYSVNPIIDKSQIPIPKSQINSNY
jgi:hypothetical protein